MMPINKLRHISAAKSIGQSSCCVLMLPLLPQALRVLGRVCFTRTRVDVRRIWQPESNRISLRWQFHGVPRIPWEVEGIFEGVSQFKLDRLVDILKA